MQNLNGKNILFFCPQFFNYELEIKRSLEELGANVIWFDDRPSNSFYSKAIIRVNKKIIKKRINNYYSGIISKMKDQVFDYLFFVNPEAITTDILESLKISYPHAKTILFMWDSFKNRKQNIELLSLFDYKYTFDPHDAVSFGLNFRPLFYTNSYNNEVLKPLKYDLLFIGTAHSDRYELVKNIVEVMGVNNPKLYFFLSSKLLYFFKILFDKSFKKVKYNDISFNSLNHNEIAALMSESKVILDINHPNQIGLTMRSLETLGTRRKLITTNKDILNYDFYLKSNILVIDREHPNVDINFFNTPFNEPDEDIVFKYSIKGWATEIFQLKL